MIKPAHFILLLLLCAVVWESCTQEGDPCLLPTTVTARFGTYHAVETDTGIAVFDSTLPKPIIGVVDSTGLFASRDAAKKFSVILSPLADSTRFFIIPDSAKQSQFDIDTLTLFYNRKLQFISTACGYTYYYTIYGERHTTNNIDSVRIANGNVTNNVNIEHVKIYF
jgi:hypothetical protein